MRTTRAIIRESTLHFTNSFREIDGHVQEAINEVYLDYFYRRNEESWKQQAYFKLPAIKKATNMLICGGNLGVVPASVPEVMPKPGHPEPGDTGVCLKDPRKEFDAPVTKIIPTFSVASPSRATMPTHPGMSQGRTPPARNASITRFWVMKGTPLSSVNRGLFSKFLTSTFTVLRCGLLSLSRT
ncbi:MAG: hypothetical protein U5L09_05760 [Bacteroidales bacterium]|nr:hypothetical protein [Bacteroidales bacterium]